VFSNLVDNAVKFSRSGARVRIGDHRAGGHVCFSVADTGAGIDAADVPHLFDRFWKGHEADRP
jgi:signal transduction histidine kinase